MGGTYDSAVGDLVELDVGIRFTGGGDLEEVARVWAEGYDGEEWFPLHERGQQRVSTAGRRERTYSGIITVQLGFLLCHTLSVEHHPPHARLGPIVAREMRGVDVEPGDVARGGAEGDDYPTRGVGWSAQVRRGEGRTYQSWFGALCLLVSQPS